MDNKKILKQEEENMKMIYSAEPSYLFRGIMFGILIEILMIVVILGISYLLALL